jgi:hypothetical protein
VRTLLPAAAGSRLTIVRMGRCSRCRSRDSGPPAAPAEAHDLHYVPAIAALAEAATGSRPAAQGALLVDRGPLQTEPGAERCRHCWARREVAAVRAVLGPGTTLLTAGDANEAAVRARLAGPASSRHARRGQQRGDEPVVPRAPSVERRRRPSPRRRIRPPPRRRPGRAERHRTALGRSATASLARAFLSAGPLRVATQWTSPDRVSYEVMREFYARRARAQQPGPARRALCPALRAGRSVPTARRCQTPRLWAGFI